MARTLRNRGGGILSFLFGKRMTSAEIREQRLAGIPGTHANVRKQKMKMERRMNKDRASQKTRHARRSAIIGTVENREREIAKATATRRSGSGTRRKGGSK